MAKTKADRIRELRAKGLKATEIADRLGCSASNVYAQNSADANRARVRLSAKKWQRKARKNPVYYAAELAALREKYHSDSAYRARRAEYSRQWRERQRASIAK